MVEDKRLRELVAEQVREWPKTVAPKALLELLDGFARKVAAAALTVQGETEPGKGPQSAAQGEIAPVDKRNHTRDILAWLDGEQSKAERWRSNDKTGVFRFGLTGPELNRIRHALSADGEWPEI